MIKAERRNRVRKYNLCRKCLKSLKRVTHNVQDCPAPCCAICKKDHHTLICSEEKREQNLHRAHDEEEDSGNEDDQDLYEDKDLFDPNLKFHFSHDIPGYYDGDDY